MENKHQKIVRIISLLEIILLLIFIINLICNQGINEYNINWYRDPVLVGYTSLMSIGILAIIKHIISRHTNK